VENAEELKLDNIRDFSYMPSSAFPAGPEITAKAKVSSEAEELVFCDRCGQPYYRNMHRCPLCGFANQQVRSAPKEPERVQRADNQPVVQVQGTQHSEITMIECLYCGISYPSNREICPGCWLTKPQQKVNVQIERTKRLLRELYTPPHSKGLQVGDLQRVPRGQQKKGPPEKSAGGLNDLSAVKDDRGLNQLYDPTVSDRIPSRADNEKIMTRIKQQDEARAAAHALALAFSGPAGWAILAGCAVAAGTAMAYLATQTMKAADAQKLLNDNIGQMPGNSRSVQRVGDLEMARRGIVGSP